MDKNKIDKIFKEMQEEIKYLKLKTYTLISKNKK